MSSILFEKVRAYERRLMYEALQATGGHQTKAAHLLGVTRSHFNVKISRARRDFPDQRWDDPPLAWAIRRDRDRVALGACWTREEIAAEAKSQETIALVLDEGEARLLAKAINSMIATRPNRLIGGGVDGAGEISSAGAPDEQHPARMGRRLEDVPV